MSEQIGTCPNCGRPVLGTERRCFCGFDLRAVIAEWRQQDEHRASVARAEAEAAAAAAERQRQEEQRRLSEQQVAAASARDREAEQQRLAEQQRAVELQRAAEVQQQAEAAAGAAERQRQEEQRRLAEQQRAVELQRATAAQQQAEAQRLAERKAADERQLLEQQRAADLQRTAEAQRLAEQKAAAERQRLEPQPKPRFMILRRIAGELLTLLSTAGVLATPMSIAVLGAIGVPLAMVAMWVFDRPLSSLAMIAGAAAMVFGLFGAFHDQKHLLGYAVGGPVLAMLLTLAGMLIFPRPLPVMQTETRSDTVKSATTTAPVVARPPAADRTEAALARATLGQGALLAVEIARHAHQLDGLRLLIAGAQKEAGGDASLAGRLPAWQAAAAQTTATMDQRLAIYADSVRDLAAMPPAVLTEQSRALLADPTYAGAEIGRAVEVLMQQTDAARGQSAPNYQQLLPGILGRQ